MPLQEISANLHKDAADTVPKATDVVATMESATSFRSTAVQSMLKTTTELGDSGPFAIRPSRIPRSASRQQASRHRSGSSDNLSASQRRRRSHRYHGPRPAPSSSALSGHETIHSAHTSLPSGLRSERVGHRHGSHTMQGLASPATGPHTLHTHRSLITLRSQRDFQSLHSRSPMLHPAHGRRPRYRASSPAFSDAYSHRYGRRSGHPRLGSIGTVASSPVSMYPPRPGLSGYRPELNNSMSSFLRLPSPAVSMMNVAVGRGYSGHRATTPMSASLQNIRPAWNNSAVSLKGLPKSPTESPAPQYYDYSESFLEEDCFSPPLNPAVANFPFNMDQTILENLSAQERRHAQSPFGTLPGSTFKPSELPTGHNRRPSEQSKHSYSGLIPPRKSSLAATAVPLKDASAMTKQGVEHAADQEHLEGHPRDEKYNPRASTASRRTAGSTHSSAFFPNASRSPRDLTTLAARVHSPIFDQKPSATSISELMEQNGQNHEESSQKGIDDRHQLRAKWQLPSFSFRPLSFGSYSSDIRDRPKTSGEVRSKEVIEILSPMPERPMSSQSRKRFSRILEIDDHYFADQCKQSYQSQTFARLHAVEDHPDLHYLETISTPHSEVESHVDSVTDQDVARHPSGATADRASSNDNPMTGQLTIHDKSTVESLLDRHIECLGLNEDLQNPFEVEGESELSDDPPDSSGESTVRLSSNLDHLSVRLSMRPTTSGSTCKHTSLASSERRMLMPRRLFASMDARLPPGEILQIFRETSVATLSAVTSTDRQRSSGWQTLPSTSGILSSQSANKASVTSGDLGDVDSDPPQTKFKVRRLSEFSVSPCESSGPLCERDNDSRQSRGFNLHRRSKSDMLARQASHQRRRMRILLKAKRRSASLGQLEDVDQNALSQKDMAGEEDWTTEDSPEEISETSPVAGYAELSADSVAAQPPTTISAGSVLLPSSIPRRWTSMLAAMPAPVKKGVEIMRKASVRTVHSHRSNTSVIEPLNSTTRFSSHIPRSGSVPQLEPPEFGPPLTSSDLNLSLRFPEPPQPSRPPLREVQSFFSDDSSAQRQRSVMRKRFDLHSFRSGLTRSSNLMGTRHGSVHRGAGVKLSHSCQIKGLRSFDYPGSNFGDTVPMSDFAYRKRKVLDRVKDWWKRQCMQRTLSLMTKKNGRQMRT